MKALTPRETGRVWQAMGVYCQAGRRNTISTSGPHLQLPVANPINACAKSELVPYARLVIFRLVALVQRVRLARRATSAKIKVFIRAVPLANTMDIRCRHQRAHADRVPKENIALKLVVRVKVFAKFAKRAIFVLHQ